MGTRHLIAVQKGFQYKVAQYGQWDGYPEGQGINVLKFLNRYSLSKFSRMVNKLSFITQEDREKLHSEAVLGAPKLLKEFSRDTGSEILAMIQNGECTKLNNSINFAGDSLFCEWAYVIDLDNDAFEIYKGFNKEPLFECERFFAYNDKDSEYRPIRLKKKYSLKDLPTQAQFLKDLEEV